MSAHFSVPQEDGRVIYYRLKMSVLEGALLGFAERLGIESASDRSSRPKRKRTMLRRREA